MRKERAGQDRSEERTAPFPFLSRPPRSPRLAGRQARGFGFWYWPAPGKRFLLAHDTPSIALPFLAELFGWLGFRFPGAAELIGWGLLPE